MSVLVCIENGHIPLIGTCEFLNITKFSQTVAEYYKFMVRFEAHICLFYVTQHAPTLVLLQSVEAGEGTMKKKSLRFYSVVSVGKFSSPGEL